MRYFVFDNNLKPSTAVRHGAALLQVENLRAVLRRREWEASAKRAQSNRLTLAGLQDILAEALAFGVEGSELYSALYDRLQKGMKWNNQATALLQVW